MQPLIDFFKKNWIIVVIVLIGGIYLHLRLSNAEKVLQLAIDSQNNQLTEVQKTHQNELEQRDKALQNYQEKVKSLEEDYNKKSADLAIEKKKKIQIIVKYYNDPVILISKIQEKYGFQYVK